MKQIIQKKVAISPILILTLQLVLVLGSVVYAENDALEKSLDDGENTQLLNQTNAFNFEEQAFNQPQALEEMQDFSFVDKTFRTTVGQSVILRFTSDVAANEVLVRIPAHGQIVESAFSNGESIQHSHGEYWTLKTSSPQTEFELPVVFDTPGKYFLTIDHDSDHFYLEVDDNTSGTTADVPEVQEETGLIEKEVLDEKEQQPTVQETEAVDEFPVAVQTVMATEKNLPISEELIAAEDTRILEEITDPQNRSVATVSNWSQFRSAWNNSSRTLITSNRTISFSSSILGDSLNPRNTSVQISIPGLNLGTSNNSLTMIGYGNSLFLTTTYIITENSSSTAPVVNVPTNSNGVLVQLQSAYILNRRNSACISLMGTRNELRFLSGGVGSRVHNTGAVSPIRTNDTIIDFSRSNNLSYIGSEGTSNNLVPPLSTVNTNIKISNNNVMMGGRYAATTGSGSFTIRPLTTFYESWNSVTASLSGINGAIVDSATSNPNDFTNRYLFNVPTTNYRTLILNGRTSDGFIPPIPVYDLSLQASPREGGSPSSDTESLAQNKTTSIHANPNEGYRFVKWEIISGTDARVANETVETTTFTMGNSNAVVRAVYEEELSIIHPLDPLEPDKEVEPENPPNLPEDQGRLSIDFASRFAFGQQRISAQTKRYYAQPQRLLNSDGTVNDAEERPNYIQISDRRPEEERHGWKLAVTQNTQFTDLQENELRGARLLLTNQQIASVQGSGEPVLQNQDGVNLIPGEKTELLTAGGGQGTGTWVYRFGDGESAGESVALEVPPTASPRATTYETLLTWELSAVPGN